jgi:hypothetical protein
VASVGLAPTNAQEQAVAQKVQARLESLMVQFLGVDGYRRAGQLIQESDRARAAGDADQADRYLQEAVALHVEVFGPRHALTVDLRSRSDRPTPDLLPLLREVFGDDHPNTLRVAHQLGLS